jgi:GTP-binding protein
MQNMENRGDSMTHLQFEIPARGLIGLRSRVLTATQGEGIVHHSFLKYSPMVGETPHRVNGVMIATDAGPVTSHSVENLAERGMLFVTPGEQVYTGMVVGEHNRDNDLPVNIVRTKQLGNFRVAFKEQTVVLKAARKFSLEAALEYIEDDELVEITPKNIRMRKRILSEAERKKSDRSSRDREASRTNA